LPKLRGNIHFDDFSAIGADTGSLSDDFSREDEIFQDLFMDFGQGARHGTRLFLATVTAGFAHDTALADKHDMTIRKLLFEFTGQASPSQSHTTCLWVPLLDLVEARKKRDRDENDNSLLSPSDINLPSAPYSEIEVGGVEGDLSRRVEL
jgi:hypothetical protein